MPESRKLAEIREGMDVFDSTGDRIGAVEDIFLGTGSDEAEAYTNATTNTPDINVDGGDSVLENFAEAFDDHDMPDVLRRRLLYHGYIQIDTGLLGADRFATAEQVARVSNEGVHLNVSNDELIKG